ncbi:MAG: toxin-antitoxin system [Vicinamibacteria bacterium]|jgi:plasmid stability protein|nr:toxin-antitoxin system [Vicinamibacteria bacterium]
MAQLIVRNLEEPLVEGLRRRARRHNRSTEAEVREILRAAVGGAEARPRRLGTELASLFAGRGLPGEIEELRGQSARPARLRG